MKFRKWFFKSALLFRLSSSIKAEGDFNILKMRITSKIEWMNGKFINKVEISGKKW